MPLLEPVLPGLPADVTDILVGLVPPPLPLTALLLVFVVLLMMLLAMTCPGIVVADCDVKTVDVDVGGEDEFVDSVDDVVQVPLLLLVLVSVTLNPVSVPLLIICTVRLVIVLRSITMWTSLAQVQHESTGTTARVFLYIDHVYEGRVWFWVGVASVGW